jgi:hypothetical protein
MAAYQGNVESANELALESSPIGTPLLEFFNRECEWSGTASELLRELEEHVAEQLKRSKGWPKNGRAMSGQLKRIAPNLRANGWLVDFRRESGRRIWWIHPGHDANHAGDFASSSCVTNGRCNSMQSDADQRNLSAHDANDANDAKIQALKKGHWEEGEL